MANTFKSSVSQNVGTSPVTVYTAPASTQTTLIGMSLCNVGNQGVLVDVTYVKGGITVFLQRQTPIPVGGTLIVVGGDQKIVLEAGNNIRVQSSVATSVDVVCSYLEITP